MIEIVNFDIGKADCYLIKIENKDRYFNLLVDCGKKGMSNKIEEELNGNTLNGIVVTHIDDDHIKGAIELIENINENGFIDKTFIIYNKYDETLISYRQGAELLRQISEKFSERYLIKSYARNFFSENKMIERERVPKTTIETHILSKQQRRLLDEDRLTDDVIYITLLTPGLKNLKEFMKKWSENKVDAEMTNSSSIAFLLEYESKKVLMLGDANTNEVLYSLKETGIEGVIDFIKISHHGAEKNNSHLLEITETYKCKKFSVSIPRNHKGKASKHPNEKIIEGLIDIGCDVFTGTLYEVEENSFIKKIKIVEKIEV